MVVETSISNDKNGVVGAARHEHKQLPHPCDAKPRVPLPVGAGY